MPSRLGLRLALEAAFLIAVAVAVGFAALGAAWIVGVMAVAWLLVALIEWAAWREHPRPRARPWTYSWPPAPAPAPHATPRRAGSPEAVSPGTPIEHAPVPFDRAPLLPPESAVDGESRNEPSAEASAAAGSAAPRQRGLFRRRPKDEAGDRAFEAGGPVAVPVGRPEH